MDAKAHGRLEKIHVLAIAAAVFTLPLLMWPGLTDYNYTKSIASILLVSVLLMLWGFTAWRRPSWTLRIPWALIPIAGLVITCGLSAFRATAPQVVAQSSVLLITFVLLLWMVANVVRNQNDVRWILGALLVAGFLAALYGVLQYVGVLPGPPGSRAAGAIISTMGNRNHLGGFLLYLLFPTTLLLFQIKPPALKLMILTALCFVLSTTMLLNQMSVRIVFPLIMIAFVVGQFVFRARRPLRDLRWWLAALVSFAALLYLFPVLSSFTAPVSENESLIQAVWTANSGDARTQDWWIGAEMMADYPITGVGLGHYKLQFIPYKVEFLASPRGSAFKDYLPRASQAHNEYVQVGAELGIIGLVMLFASLGTLATSLWIRLQRSDDDHRIALLLLTAGILGFLIHSLVSFPAHVVGSALEFIVFCGLALSPAYGSSLSFTWRISGWKAKGIHVAIIVLGLAVSAIAGADMRANWLMERGIDQVEAGLFSAGKATLKRSLSLDFFPRQTYYYLAIAQIQLGELDEAQHSLEKCMTRFIDEASLLNYANLLVNTGQSEKAFEPLGLLLSSSPRADIARRATYLQALAWSETGDPERAIAQIEELLANNPSYETPLIGLGSIYESIGRLSEAASTYEKGLAQVEAALTTARASLNQGRETLTTQKLAALQSTIDRLIYERATLLERLRALAEVGSP